MSKLNWKYLKSGESVISIFCALCDGDSLIRMFDDPAHACLYENELDVVESIKVFYADEKAKAQAKIDGKPVPQRKTRLYSKNKFKNYQDRLGIVEDLPSFDEYHDR